MTKALPLFFLLNLFATVLLAQNVVIHGTVKNESGEPLEAVSVRQVGVQNAAITKKDGTFELKNVPPGAKLQIYMVGYKLALITLKPDQTAVNVTLKTSVTNLKEVTINNGLYKRPVGNFTGAAKAYTGEELKSINPRDVMSALAIADPSVTLTQNNQFGSDPNKLPVIQIRGQNNLTFTGPGAASGATAVSQGDISSTYLSNPNQPLIILDGFETTMQVIYDMDINLIATVTVLKDAAATVAYGSKAANGVIVFETKQPVPGKLRVTYSVNASLQVPDLSSYHLMNASQLLQAQSIAGIYNSPNNYTNTALQEWYNYRLYNVQRGVNTNWLTQPVQTGFGLSNSLSLSGGSGPLRYSFSGNFNTSEGAMKGSDRDRYGLTYNVSYLAKKVKFSNQITFGYSKGTNSPWGSFSSYAQLFPYFSNRDASGNIIKVLEPTSVALGFDNPAPGGLFMNPAYNATLNGRDYQTHFKFKRWNKY